MKRKKMKSMYIRRIGAMAAGAVMLGAALSGAVSAAMDSTGLDKGFFYDANYNPIVQIVVGEKGLATDSVAAGNIAATIGNLAYSTKSKTVGSTAAAAGKVVLGISARGATGKFEQAQPSLTVLSKAFYDENQGLMFANRTETYERGEFITYSLACDTQTRTEAGILKEATYNNIHCLFCETLCLASLENPSHDMTESIKVDYSAMHWYEYGLRRDDAEDLKLKIDAKAVSYSVDTGEIPISTRIGTAADPVDFEWRGKMILFGEEYYMKNVKGTDEIYLAKGKVLDDVSSEGYTAEYMGYKFKIDHLIYSQEYQVAGILMDVEKPDGTVVQTQISKMANGIVDDIELAGVYAEEANAVATASIIVYDTTSNVKLEDGKDLVFGGEEKKYWRVSFGTTTAGATPGLPTTLDTTEYHGTAGTVLENVTITYRHDIELEEGEALVFPSTYQLKFDGFRTNSFKASPNSGDGEGNVKIEKDGKYQATISFTGDDGQRYNDIRLDQGPLAEGDKFVLAGKVMEYSDAEEKTDEVTMEVSLENLIDGGKEKYDLIALNTTTLGNTKFTLVLKAWEESVDNDDTKDVKPDAISKDSDVYVGSIRGVNVIYDGGDLYFVPDAANWTSAALNGTTIGVNAAQVGEISNFEIDGNHLYVSVLNEAGTDLNAEPTGTRTPDTDDTIVKIENEKGEYLYVDMSDRNFDSDLGDVYYDESVKASTKDVTNATTKLVRGTDDIATLNDDRDTLLVLPDGGDRIKVDYGGDLQVESVEILHPQEEVMATIFLGTSEQETLLESVITKEDEGKEKTAGCCSYIVKEFSVTATGGQQTVTETAVHPIVGNLVVPEIGADQTKNLVIVGGPAVNGLSTVTAEQIAAAPQRYVVKKDGKKLIVAGYTAADTVDAGNALISWLQKNVH